MEAVFLPVAVTAFGIWAQELPDLPRIIVSAIGAYFMTPYVSGGVLWFIDFFEPDEPGHTFIWGLCAFACYGFCRRWLHRMPKLSWLL